MVRGAFLSGAGMVASMAGSLIAAVIFGRMLPESQVGVFWMLILLCDGLLILSNFGLQNALPKLIADAPEPGRGGMGASILLAQGAVSLSMGVPLLAVWLLLPDPRIFSSNATWLDLYPHVWILPLLCLAATQRDTALAILAGMNRYSGRAAGLIVGSAVQVTLVAVLLAWFKLGLVALALSTLVSYAAAAAWLVWQAGGFRFSKALWRHYREAVTFSVPLYLNNVLGFVFNRVDTLLVAMLLGSPTLVAYFEMAKRLPNAFTRILGAALVPYLPGLSSRIAEGDYPGSARLLNTVFQLVTFLGYSAVLAVMVVQRPLIVMLFSERYIPCLSVLWLLMTGACLALQTGILGLSLVATGRPASVTRANVVTALVSLAANSVFIPRFGIVGAAWAFLGAIAVGMLLQVFALHRRGLRLTWRSVFALFLAVLVTLAAGQFPHSPGAPALALALFVILCLSTSVVRPRQLVQWTRHILPGSSEHATRSRSATGNAMEPECHE